MGILEELIIMAKDAIDEANQRGKKRPPTPEHQRTEEELEALRQVMAERAEQARQEKEQARREAAEQRAEQQRQQEAQERERERQRQRQAAEAARATRAGPIDPRRIARLTRHPAALREMIVLRELLDKPLALRRPRR